MEDILKQIAKTSESLNEAIFMDYTDRIKPLQSLLEQLISIYKK